MSKPTIAAIAAIGQNRELGKNNDLIWRIPADLQRLKKLTSGHTLIMGRKTHESIGRPLPHRTNIVVTRNSDYQAEGCMVVDSMTAAIAAVAAGETKVFMFGGAEIYAAALPLTTKLYLTCIAATDPEADTFFPEFDSNFEITKEHPANKHNGLAYQWVDFVRKAA